MTETTARKLLYARSERMCERCGLRRATNAHHRRAAGRRWDVHNLLDLCGSGTTGCHGWVTDQEVALAREYGWVVRERHDPLWVPVLVRCRWVYLAAGGGIVLVRNTAGLPPIERAFPDRPGLVRAREALRT